MNSLIQFSMKQVAAVIILCCMLFGGGIYAATSLKVDNMPDISLPIVMVTVPYPGSPQDVMEDVTKPLEKKISGMENVKTIESTSSDQMATIIVTFEEGADPDRKKADMESLFQETELPLEAGRPKVSTFGVSSIPTYYLAIQAGEEMDQTELEHHFEHVIRPGFQAMPGLDHMDVIGERKTEVAIRLSPELLRVNGLTPAQVSEAVQSAMAAGPAGTVELDGNTLLARMDNGLRSISQLEAIPLAAPDGSQLTVGSLGSVAEIRESAFAARMDARPAIGVLLYKTGSANAVQFTDQADDLMERWTSELKGITFKQVYNYADEVKQSIGGLLREVMVGAVLASLMILVFLRNMRMTLIVLVSIPLSVLIALLMMKWLDISLNIMTLGGMFIAIGRVVDDSIVVIENIYSKLEQAARKEESVILLATKEVANAITSSTLTTVGVFAPIGLISGPAGQLFRPFAVTLSCAILASLAVALTVIPMLAKLLVLRSANAKAHVEPGPSAFTEGYRRILEMSLRHRWKTLAASALLFVFTMVALVPQLSFTYMPEGNPPRQFYFTVKLPYETSLKTTDAVVKDMEAKLRSASDKAGRPLFTFVEALVGYGGDPNAIPYMAQIYTEVNEDADVEQVKREYKESLLSLVPAGSEIDTRTLSGDSGGGEDFSYVLKGEDSGKLRQAAAIIKEAALRYPELTEVKDSLSEASSEVTIRVDPQKALQTGVSPAAVQHSLRTWLFEQKLGEYRFDEGLRALTVQTGENGRQDLEGVGNIPMETGNGGMIRVADIADVTRELAPASIKRVNEEQVVMVTAKIIGKNKGGISADIAAELDQIELPEGVSRSVGGISENIGDSFGQLFVAMGAAIGVVYLIMVLTFGNASAPFSILFSLPFAAIGGVFGLFVTNESLNITSLIGFMMLIGIVVTNAIVFIDMAQQLRKAGFAVREALVEAGVSRLRPIIMTAGATIVALLPLAFGFGHGTLISRGLAVVVIGGLAVSTLLTLLVVPVMYDLIGRGKRSQVNALPAAAPEQAEGKGM
ncbi:efflux RND transporter permease subunit [Paenibacillus melissococcoides]|uniref:Efflux RND transporter permease subunit n=1 Tax=Paenibacillus melissococcoides TaxID=2912268 RepID=A0ABN8UEL3_9BACL|nr:MULTISPECIES: efflux RND transporter permease subunit [Paenibacillus]MEB9892114.1 efflux RND transporter permease subunit [Bacillus cereus]CAH8248654.1 efflux RND transporter permease subunit [Paenibacillus melissococcoides]CAH8714121.1 efflux RND transporter permease subunit [Paenibacillus melissococcoides]CAH8720111.1 efflux RND transporter permease subunit [Paenibacillus melissococcoides]GIO82431.1 multidrug transporter AcrB [Paenibacillus dendritiformis]